MSKKVDLKELVDKLESITNGGDQIKSSLTEGELKKLVIENVNKAFEADSKHFVDGCLKYLAKEKAGA